MHNNYYEHTYTCTKHTHMHTNAGTHMHVHAHTFTRTYVHTHTQAYTVHVYVWLQIFNMIELTNSTIYQKIKNLKLYTLHTTQVLNGKDHNELYNSQNIQYLSLSTCTTHWIVCTPHTVESNWSRNCYQYYRNSHCSDYHSKRYRLWWSWNCSIL